MNIIDKAIAGLDNFQRSHRLPGFILAVIKKYNDDKAGNYAALLTYYGFLALFPLLLVLTTVLTSIAGSNPALKNKIIEGTTSYFPVLGNQLSEHITTLHRSGIALVVGILLIMYGARSVADAFRQGINHIWHVPSDQRDGFPISLLKNLGIIVVGGVGFTFAAIVSSYMVNIGHHSLPFFILAAVLNFFILFGSFLLLLKLSLPGKLPLRQTRSGAVFSAIALMILQSAGSYLLARQLKNLDALYSYFALPLGLLFWIFLQAQTMLYALEIAAVRSQNLWPRGLVGDKPTAADKRAANIRDTVATK